MMEEDDVSKIAKELEEAALTDVTQAPIKETTPPPPSMISESKKEPTPPIIGDSGSFAPPVPVETLVSSIPSVLNVDSVTKTSLNKPQIDFLLDNQNSSVPCYLPAMTAAPAFPGFQQPVLASQDSNPSSSPPPNQHQTTNPYRAVTGLSAHSPAPAIGATNIFVPPYVTPQQQPQQFVTPSASPAYQPSQYGNQPIFQHDSCQHHAGHGHSHGYGEESFLEIPHDHGPPTWGSQYNHSHDSYKSSSDGLFGWFSNVGNKVIEKTKSSVESMITTLDPGMKAVIYSGGDVDIVVTTSRDDLVDGIRQAFQEVFGRATVAGLEARSDIAPQPVGFAAGLKGAENKIENLRRSVAVHERQTLVSTENFIHEIISDKWFDFGCLVLKDPLRGIELTVFTQATPINPAFIQQAQEFTPSDYELRWSGLSVTIGEVISRNLPRIHPFHWHKELTGMSSRDIYYNAAKVLANLYKTQCH